MRGAQKKPDLVEGIALAFAVTQGALLDATMHLTWGITGELDDVKGVEHAGVVLELIVDGVLAVPGRGIALRFAPPHGSLLCALLASSHARCQTFLGPGPLKRPWDDPLREWSMMPVSSLGPRRCRSWWCHMPLIDPQHPHPCETGGVIRCGLQERLDMGPHGIPHGCKLSSQATDGGSLEAQLSDLPADHPRPQMRPGSAHRVVLLEEGRDLAGVFAAYPASLKLPDPRWDPSPGRVDHLHHHTLVTLCDHPTPRAANQLVARLNIEHQSLWGAGYAHQMEALQVDEHNTPITTIKRGRAAGGVRHRPRSLTTAGVEVHSSSRTSTSTRNPRPTLGHPHSTRKGRLFPLMRGKQAASATSGAGLPAHPRSHGENTGKRERDAHRKGWSPLTLGKPLAALLTSR